MKKRRIFSRKNIQDFFLITIGSIILALNFDIFQAPTKLAPGGVSGISIIVNHFTGLPKGGLILLLNIPVLILGFIFLGRFSFLLRTIYVVVVYSVGIDLFAIWLPSEGFTNDLLINALYGGVVGGIGTGLITRGRSTAAGTGTISRIVQIRTGIPVSQIYLFVDGGVVLALGALIGWLNALYAMLMLFVWGLATDYVLEGPSVVRTVFIVTDAPDQISTSLIERLGVGVTAWPAQGMFTGEDHATLFCTVSRADVPTVTSIVEEVDANAFVVIAKGHQARGGKLKRAFRETRGR